MKKRIIYRVAAIAFIFGGLSFTNSQHAKASRIDLWECVYIYELCREGCDNNYGHNTSDGRQCRLACDDWLYECRVYGADYAN